MATETGRAERSERASRAVAPEDVRLAAGLLLTLLLVVVVYAQVSRFEFVNWDDQEYVTANPMVRGGLDGDGFRRAWSTFQVGNWHPLTMLSHMLDVELYGLEAGGHHRTNLVLHVANTLLAAALLIVVTGRRGESVVAAGIFGLHPLHVESVAWISDRKDLLAAFFGMLAILAWVAYARHRSRALYAASLVFYSLGLLAKPILVTLPVLFVLLDFWPLGRGGWARERRTWALIREKIPFAVIASVVIVIALRAQAAAGSLAPLAQVPFTVRLQTVIVNYATYLGRCFWPLRLSFYELHPFFRGESLGAGRVLAAAGVIGLVTAGCWVMRQRSPELLAGWSVYLLLLLPTCGLTQLAMAIRADRYMYMPLLGIAFAVSVGSAELLNRLVRSSAARTAAARTVVAILFVLLATQSASQASIWRDSTTLAESGLQLDPQNCQSHRILGDLHFEAGRYTQAAAERRLAFEICHLPETANNLGLALAAGGLHDEAIPAYREALRQRPDNASFRANLGWSLSRIGRVNEALDQLEQAVRDDPGSIPAHTNLAAVLIVAGRPAEAVRHLERVLAAEPDSVAAHTNLAAAYVAMDEGERAAREREIVKRLQAVATGIDGAQAPAPE